MSRSLNAKVFSLRMVKQLLDLHRQSWVGTTHPGTFWFRLTARKIWFKRLCLMMLLSGSLWTKKTSDCRRTCGHLELFCTSSWFLRQELKRQLSRLVNCDWSATQSESIKLKKTSRMLPCKSFWPWCSETMRRGQQQSSWWVIQFWAFSLTLTSILFHSKTQVNSIYSPQRVTNMKLSLPYWAHSNLVTRIRPLYHSSHWCNLFKRGGVLTKTSHMRTMSLVWWCAKKPIFKL